MKIGAHVSTAGGVHKAVENALAIEAECIQIFASSPRAWAFKSQDSGSVDKFLNQINNTPVFLHGSYLINLGGDSQLLQKSITSLVEHMHAASRLKAKGVIFHCGSHKGAGFEAIFEQAVNCLETVLEQTPNETLLIIENSAGAGGQIGSTLAEVGQLISKIDNPRLNVCIDTQHTIASGYDISKPETLESFADEFEHEIGINRLVAVHANDSKTELGSGKDRHENIGYGYIGDNGFRNILRHELFTNIPFILEVPGIEGNGPDLANINRLKKIREEFSLPE
ncbi:MAG: deoxyribonuclease IV [Chloroflexota bacterium]|jgi:deoxyribonuclease-4|tara:strand:+ start:2019 stop:2864 length:846 start_codon:yes stop_codon:yes gene_type:complete